jgi:hypothetical protein
VTIRPNELNDPGTRAAWARVEALFQNLDDLGSSVLLVASRGGLSPADREELHARAEDLADRLGRGELLEAATKHLDAALASRLAGPVYRYSTNTARPEDLASVASALRDLLLVTVVEDRLATEDADRLGAAGRFVLGLPGGGAVLAETRAAGVVIPEPTEADWADAEAGPAAVDPDSGVIGSRRTVAVGLWGIGAVVAAGLLAIWFAGGNPAVGLGGSVVALLVAASLASRR